MNLPSNLNPGNDIETQVQQELLIFVLDDDPTLLTVVKKQIELLHRELPYKDVKLVVKTFVHPQACFDALHLNPDLIFVDYYLNAGQDMTGDIVMMRIREICPLVHSAIITSRQDRELVFDMMRNGIRDYIVKNMEFHEELKNFVMEFVHKKCSQLGE